MTDVRLLGAWLPIYLAYRATEMFGLLGRWTRAGNRTDKADLEYTPTIGRDWLDNLIPVNNAETKRIVDGTIGIFGASHRLDDPPNWHRIGQHHWDFSSDWWKIDLYANQDTDVRWIWELGRHRHLVVLARSLATEAYPSRTPQVLNTHLRSWLKMNPPGVGIHWCSNLELALRSLAWIQILGMAADHLDDDVEKALLEHLHHSGRHIVARLPLTVSTMRNNHLVGDAVGLVAIGRALPSDRSARRWATLGDFLLRWHIPRHVRPDGSSAEDSLGYRCFVLELLTMRILLGDPPDEVSKGAARLSGHLRRAGVGATDTPRFGDWDGGHVFAGSVPDLDPTRSLGIYKAVSGIGSSTEPPTVALAGGSSPPTRTSAAVVDGSDAGGSLGRIAKDPWTGWLKCAAEESHGHSDLLSVCIQHEGKWAIGDPGNGSYNRSIEERNYFRTAIAHSVVRVEGEDQRAPHRRFRWRYQPTGRLGKPFDAGPFRVMWGTHDAYRRIRRPQDCMRACLVSETAFVVVDWIVGEPTDFAMSLPLHPDVQWADDRVELNDGTRIGLALPGQVRSNRGSRKPYDGWWADAYDSVRPATRLEITGTTEQPIVWALFTGAEPTYQIRGDEVSVDDVTLRPERRGDRLGLLSD